MGPKSKYQQIRMPPKKAFLAAAYGLMPVNDFVIKKCENTKKTSPRLSTTRKKLKRNRDREISTPLTRHWKKAKTVDNLIPTSRNESGLVTEQIEHVIEPDSRSANTFQSSDGSNCQTGLHEDGYTILTREFAKTQENLTKIKEMLNVILQRQRIIEESQKEIKEDIQGLKNKTLAYEGREKWLLENGVNLPMESIEEFMKHCSLIEKSSECRKILETSVHFAVNKKKSLTKNIASVIRKYFSKDLAGQFTVVKSVKGKIVLEGTSFHNFMLRYFLEKSTDGILPKGLTETDFNKALGEVLCNAKGWNRSKKTGTVYVNNKD